jgi:hypothetical protein
MKDKNNQNTNITSEMQSFIFKEVNSFRGIPYADYFNVVTEWKITEIMENHGNNPSTKGCTVQIYLDFVFLKSTWLQGTIESNTKAELLEVFDIWYETVTHHLRASTDKKLIHQTHHLRSTSTDQMDKVDENEKEKLRISLSKDEENQIGEEDEEGMEEDDGKFF